MGAIVSSTGRGEPTAVPAERGRVTVESLRRNGNLTTRRPTTGRIEAVGAETVQASVRLRPEDYPDMEQVLSWAGKRFGVGQVSTIDLLRLARTIADELGVTWNVGQPTPCTCRGARCGSLRLCAPKGAPEWSDDMRTCFSLAREARLTARAAEAAAAQAAHDADLADARENRRIMRAAGVDTRKRRPEYIAASPREAVGVASAAARKRTAQVAATTDLCEHGAHVGIGGGGCALCADGATRSYVGAEHVSTDNLTWFQRAQLAAAR